MMSEKHGHAPIVPDINATRRIDIVSRRFEADWRAGKSPAIGDYLPMNSPAWCAVSRQLRGGCFWLVCQTTPTTPPCPSIANRS